MNRNAGTFRNGYAPGGLSADAARRQRARRAGIRSGVVRRQLRDVHGPRKTQRVKQLTAPEFETAYAAMCEREGRPFDRRGLNSHYELYVAHMTRYRVQGNGYETTNRQSCQAMAARGRPRCRRTVQRLRKGLAAMGVLDFHHVKRSGRECLRGELDSLRVICLHQRRGEANVTLRSWSEPALKGRRLRRDKPLIAPPSAADEIRPFGADGSEEEQAGPEVLPYTAEAARRLAFLSLAELHAPGLLSSLDRQELAQLRAATSTSGQVTDLTCSSDLRGLM